MGGAGSAGNGPVSCGGGVWFRRREETKTKQNKTKHNKKSKN
jgi:hypothetical protein